MHRSASYTLSRQAQLQRALGDIGTVLPRVARGGGEFSAAGWYARIGDEPPPAAADDRALVYLGDHTGVAYVTIDKLTSPDD